MTNTTNHRATRAGTVRTFSLDDSSLVRLEWCLRFANEGLKTKATGGTLVRRALSLLQAHFEDLMTTPNTPHGIARRHIEAGQLREANRGTHHIGLSVQQIQGASTLKPMSELKADVPQRATPMEIIARDLARWAMLKEVGQGVDDSGSDSYV